jgi:hypothetical protein
VGAKVRVGCCQRRRGGISSRPTLIIFSPASHRVLNSQTKAFTQAELREWMATRDVHGNQVSPWFGVMEKSLLYK